MSSSFPVLSFLAARLAYVSNIAIHADPFILLCDESVIIISRLCTVSELGNFLFLSKSLMDSKFELMVELVDKFEFKGA